MRCDTLQLAPVVLASASKARAQMLRAAGLEIEVRPVGLDEAALRARLAGHEPSSIALALAEAKANACLEDPDLPENAFVIGADQLLAMDGRLIEKSATRPEAVSLLRRLSGRRHRLFSAAVLARGGRILWRGVEAAELEMRRLSDAFLEWYAEAAGPALTNCVGCYEIEGIGIQLMRRITGDVFTIRGLPLLSLLSALRTHGALRS